MLLWWGTRAQASCGVTSRSACECRPGNSEPQRGAERTVLDLIRLVVSHLKTVAVRRTLFLTTVFSSSFLN